MQIVFSQDHLQIKEMEKDGFIHIDKLDTGGSPKATYAYTEMFGKADKIVCSAITAENTFAIASLAGIIQSPSNAKGLNRELAQKFNLNLLPLAELIDVVSTCNPKEEDILSCPGGNILHAWKMINNNAGGEFAVNLHLGVLSWHLLTSANLMTQAQSAFNFLIGPTPTFEPKSSQGFLGQDFNLGALLGSIPAFIDMEELGQTFKESGLDKSITRGLSNLVGSFMGAKETESGGKADE